MVAARVGERREIDGRAAGAELGRHTFLFIFWKIFFYEAIFSDFQQEYKEYLRIRPHLELYSCHIRQNI